jgi:hypothetical protein
MGSKSKGREYRRLEYEHDYFGDIEIARERERKKQLHPPLTLHAENLSLSLAPHSPLFFWRHEKEVQILRNLNFEIPFGKLCGIIGPDGKEK